MNTCKHTKIGWLFNVSGFDTVVLYMNGGSTFRIGTYEPETLLAAIRQWSGREPVR